MWQLLRRPEISLEDIFNSGELENTYDEEVLEQVEIECKYEGYIQKQNEQVRRFEALEDKKLAEELNYDEINGLSREGKYKLMRIKPSSVGQASRISGVTPADINVLLIHLEKLRRQERENHDQ